MWTGKSPGSGPAHFQALHSSPPEVVGGGSAARCAPGIVCASARRSTAIDELHDGVLLNATVSVLRTAPPRHELTKHPRELGARVD